MALWTTLSDPHRRDLLDLLRDRPQTVSELVDALRLSQPAVSKHLRVLRDAGLVRVTPQAQRRIYQLEVAPLTELDAWLQPYRALWNGPLDALGARLDATAPLSSRRRTSRSRRKEP